MISNILKASFVFVLAATLSAATLAQVVTKKEVVVNPDGSYSVIEYPVGREVTVNLVPGSMISTGRGTARVIRSTDGTKVYFDVTGVPANTSTVYAYAVDPSGTPTMLGPVAISSGIGRAEFTTPMNQFMLVLSPTEGVTAFSPNNTYFRSAVPTGFTVVPRAGVAGPTAMVAGVSKFKYDVPLLGINAFAASGKEFPIRFTGELQELEGKVHINREKGSTKVKLHFEEMKEVPANKRFVLWTYAPDGQYVKLGQIVSTGRKDSGTIESFTSLTDFGLLMTVEDADVTIPSSQVYTVITPSGMAISQPAMTPVTGPATTPITDGSFSYNVPLLGINAFAASGKEFPIRFTGELSELEGKVHINREKGATKVKLRFEEMKEVPANKRFVLWTYSPDGQYTKLGQIVSTGRKDSGTIESNTALTDFGLLLTVEDAEVNIPTSRVFTVVRL
jgi:hypothetical protein